MEGWTTMRTLLAVIVLCGTVRADEWINRWESRVNEAENPEAKAIDMVKDWMFDHRGRLKSLDEETIAEGQRIVDWMKGHGIPLPARAQVAYEQVKTALLDRQIQSLRAEIVDDDGLAGDLLPRSPEEIRRQSVDDLRRRIPEPIQARYP